MVEVRLHGALASSFGRVWHLNISSPREAVEAIEANVTGFRRKISELADKGMVFRVRSKDHDYDSDDVGTNLGRIKRIDFIPIVAGASALGRFVVGAALIAASFIPGVQAAAPYMISVGLGLMVGSVAEWLTPKVKHDSGGKSLQSWSISGPTNTVDQGLPVPVIYGEVLTGGYPISAGIAASQVVNGSIGASVAIGGTTEVSDHTGAGGSFTSVVQLGAGPFNMLEPLTYAWTKSGFAGAAATRFTGTSSSSVRLEVDFSGLASNTVTTYTGTVSLTVTGKNVDGSGSSVSASTSKTVKVTIDTTEYVPVVWESTGP